MIFNTVNSLKAYIKCSDNRDLINSDDIHRITKKSYIPITTNILDNHIDHILHILAKIIGKTIFVVSKISDYLKRIK